MRPSAASTSDRISSSCIRPSFYPRLGVKLDPSTCTAGGQVTNAVIHVPEPTNEPLLSYAPGAPERKALKAQLEEMLSNEIEVPILVGGKEIRTGDLGDIRVPHDHRHLLGRFHKANASIVEEAEKAAAAAWKA